MPIESTVYQVLLVMPDDIEGERRVAKDVLLDWNSRNGQKQEIHLSPVDAAHVDLGRSGLQEEIDIILGTFWTMVDDATTGNTSLSEAVRSLAIDEGVPSMVGFSERDIPAERLNPEEYAELQEFRDDCRATGYFTYTSGEEYENQLTEALTRTMDRLLSSSENFSEKSDDPSQYDPEVDHERLQLSSSIHYDQDERNIERIIDYFQNEGAEPPYRVLDAGCGYGTVTQSRFGEDDRFDVLAIDDVSDVLKIAKDQYSAENIEYRWMDVNNVSGADFGKFDLVFVSYLFHHITNQESVLSLLWDRVREDGALMVRSCDDGQHFHYPPNEDMEWIVDITDKIPGSSDRTHGRRLPTHIKRLSPAPADMWLDLENYHTVGKNSSERREYWEVFHSNRSFYAKDHAERTATREDQRRYEDMAERMQQSKENIVENEYVFDAKSVPVVVGIK